MILEINGPYIDIINKIVSTGFADNPNEAIKQSLVAFARQLDFEEQYLVDKAVRIETAIALQSPEKLTSAEDVFALAGIE